VVLQQLRGGNNAAASTATATATATTTQSSTNNESKEAKSAAIAEAQLLRALPTIYNVKETLVLCDRRPHSSAAQHRIEQSTARQLVAIKNKILGSLLAAQQPRVTAHTVTLQWRQQTYAFPVLRAMRSIVQTAKPVARAALLAATPLSADVCNIVTQYYGPPMRFRIVCADIRTSKKRSLSIVLPNSCNVLPKTTKRIFGATSTLAKAHAAASQLHNSPVLELRNPVSSNTICAQDVCRKIAKALKVDEHMVDLEVFTGSVDMSKSFYLTKPTRHALLKHTEAAAAPVDHKDGSGGGADGDAGIVPLRPRDALWSADLRGHSCGRSGLYCYKFKQYMLHLRYTHAFQVGVPYIAPKDMKPQPFTILRP
jgi:hypothetical protein